MQKASHGLGGRRTPRTIAGKGHLAPNLAQQKSLSEYQTALQWMQEGKYEKAPCSFRKA